MSHPEISALIPEVREVLKNAHPELAAAIAAAISVVSARHTLDVRKHFASAANLSDEAALDDLPAVLQSLATTLATEGNLEALALTGPAHAAAREGQDFTAAEILGEYVLLRRNLGQEVMARLGRTPTEAEREALQSGIDGIVASMLISVLQQRAARQRLEAQALSDFASSLAHDLRNEIGGIMISLALFEEVGSEFTRQGAGSVEAAARIIAEVKTCRETMESTIAAMTRLLEAERSQHRFSVQPREVALRPLMEGVARSADRMERLHGRARGPHTVSRIVIDCPVDLVLETDPDLLTTILTNIIGNAVKYAPQGSIDFIARRVGHELRIDVGDHGPGINPEDVARIFGRFERAGGREKSGMGLGLYVARRAADLLQAPLLVDSSPGAGSRFTLVMPMSAAGEHTKRPTA